MNLQTLEPAGDETPTARIPVQRAPLGEPRLRHGPPRSGPRTWAESAAVTRRRRGRTRLSRWLALLVVLAALTAAAVIWQLADGRPLELLRDGRDLARPLIDRLRDLLG